MNGKRGGSVFFRAERRRAVGGEEEPPGRVQVWVGGI